ncbi:uncharacterized protein BP5553_10141 [Venustampulla echinocandica]|uniref:Uncharacterized protein n=1 Tax=Venustampulla echinocandica TaxID=2656787 RepID=A0A370TAG3_9HELO|nr:uncharacterized protein BP5553_10141 [Venustampulla echinocandica]RDL30796.1 hypothetical protein BP5553_10141 [Venustampulla echinocandica]
MGHRRHCNSRSCSSRGAGSLYGDSNSLVGRGGGSGFGIGGERIGYGREGCVRLDDNKAILHPRRGATRGGFMDDFLGDGFAGLGGGNMPTPPMMPQSPFGRHSRPPQIDPRKPYIPGGYKGGGPDPLLYPEYLANSPLDPLVTLYTMSGALSPGPPGSPLSSSSPISSFNPYKMDRPRMPYGPHGGPPMNYRQPYVEDYQSDTSEEDMLIEDALMQREEALFEMRDAMRFGSPYDPYGGYGGYGDPYARMRGGY